MARAGHFRELASIQTLKNTDTASDEYGNAADAWRDLGSCWADMREQPGKERIESGAMTDVGRATMRLRASEFAKSITTADRVTIRKQTWAIENKIFVGRKGDVIELSLSKGVAP